MLLSNKVAVIYGAGGSSEPDGDAGRRRQCGSFRGLRPGSHHDRHGGQHLLWSAHGIGFIEILLYPKQGADKTKKAEKAVSQLLKARYFGNFIFSESNV